MPRICNILASLIWIQGAINQPKTINLVFPSNPNSELLKKKVIEIPLSNKNILKIVYYICFGKGKIRDNVPFLKNIE